MSLSVFPQHIKLCQAVHQYIHRQTTHAKEGTGPQNRKQNVGTLPRDTKPESVYRREKGGLRGKEKETKMMPGNAMMKQYYVG